MENFQKSYYVSYEIPNRGESYKIETFSECLSTRKRNSLEKLSKAFLQVDIVTSVAVSLYERIWTTLTSAN